MKKKTPAPIATLAPPPSCPTCNNSRHVYKDGKVLRCRCIADYIRGMEYAAAGVSPIHYETPISDLLARARLSKFYKVLAQPLRSPFLGYAVLSRIDDARIALSAAALRLAIDNGRTARLVSLDACIATRFDEEERPALYAEFTALDTLVVDLDVQITNRMVPQLCMDIYTRRVSSPCVTLFLCAESVGRAVGRYGPEFSAAFGTGRIRNVGAP